MEGRGLGAEGLGAEGLGASGLGAEGRGVGAFILQKRQAEFQRHDESRVSERGAKAQMDMQRRP